jgi:hypothetical protein
MAIQDEMYKMIAQEIDTTIDTGKEKIIVDVNKAKEVAKELAALSVNANHESKSLADDLIVNIKNICNYTKS